MRIAHKYLAVFRIRFVGALQYRVAALAGMATQFAWGFMELFAFAAFYRADPGAFPMEFSQTVSYIWMQQAFLRLFFVWLGDNEISQAISGGGIAYELVRPLDLYGRWLCQDAAGRLASTALRCVPVLLVAYLLPGQYRMPLPPDLARLALFLLGTALALGVASALTTLMYITLFYTLSPAGVRTLFSSLTMFLSGSIVPIPFFPAPLRAVAELLPFAAIQNTPLRIYSGNMAGAEALRGVALQIFWLAALLLAGRLCMDRALKKVVVQGG